MSEYIRTNKFDMNEYLNTFVSKNLSSFYTLTHWRTNVRIYSYKQIWYERMSEYIRKRKIDTNECPNIYLLPIYSNIQIYSPHPVQKPKSHPSLWKIITIATLYLVLNSDVLTRLWLRWCVLCSATFMHLHRLVQGVFYKLVPHLKILSTKKLI